MSVLHSCTKLIVNKNMFLHLKIGEVTLKQNNFLMGFTLATNNSEINLIDSNLEKLKQSVFCLFKGRVYNEILCLKELKISFTQFS